LKIISNIFRKKESGFSLLELSVAVGIAAVVAVSGIIATTAFIGDVQTKSSDYITNANSSIENAEAGYNALISKPLPPVVNPASSITPTSASISWNPVATATSYEVYLDNNNVATVGENTFTYTFENLNDSQTYEYKIIAYNPGGGTESETGSFTTAVLIITPSAPTALTSSDITVDSATISWTAPDSGTAVDEYVIYLNNVEVARVNGNILTHTFTSLNGGSTYNGGLVASNGAGQSNQVSFSFTTEQIFTMAAWGRNTAGQTNIPSGLNDLEDVAAGASHSLALKSDGTVVAWGSNTDLWGGNGGQSTVPAGLNNVQAVSAGAAHSVALKKDGTVVAWGSNLDWGRNWDWTVRFGGQSNVPAGLNNVVQVSAGAVHNLALKSDGTVVAWGSNHYQGGNFGGQSNVPAGLNNVIQVAAGGSHSLALKSDGTVIAWGSNHAGQIAVPAGLNNVVEIAAGREHSMALKSDGTVVAWGGNTYWIVPPGGNWTLITTGQTDVPAGLNNVVSISAGYYHSIALKSDGTVVIWGRNDYGQTTIPNGLSNVEKIVSSSYSYHNLALIPSN
jgi:type II secretory pathway pseudopilin PulG